MAGLQDIAVATVAKATEIMQQQKVRMADTKAANDTLINGKVADFATDILAHETSLAGDLSFNATDRAAKLASMNADLAYVTDTVDASTSLFEGLADAAAALAAFDAAKSTQLTNLVSQEASDLAAWQDALGTYSDYSYGFTFGVPSGNGANGNGNGNGNS